MSIMKVKHIISVIGTCAKITMLKVTKARANAMALATALLFSVSTWADTPDTKVVMYGDSVSAGYRMARQESWPYLLAERFKADNSPIDFINESISGETTGGGLARLASVLERHQLNTNDWLLIELGGNDGLRGFPVKTLKSNLRSMIELAQKQGTNVALMPVKIPPNYGKRYTQMMEAAYVQLGEQYELPLVPFFMEQVALQPEFMMADGIHPTVNAQGFILDMMQMEVEKLALP